MNQLGTAANRNHRCDCKWCERTRFIRRLKWRMFPRDWKKLEWMYNTIADEVEWADMQMLAQKQKPLSFTDERGVTT